MNNVLKSELSSEFEAKSITFSIDSISEPYISADTNYINITFTTSGKVLVLLYPPGGGGYISLYAHLGGAQTIQASFSLTQGDKVTPNTGEYQIIAYPIGDDGTTQLRKAYDSKEDTPAVRANLTFSGANLSVSSFEYEIDNTFGRVTGINVSIENTGDLAAFGDHSRVFLKNATHEFDNGWEVSARVNLPPGQITQLLINAETASMPVGTYSLVLRVIDFANLLLLEEVLVGSLTITGTMLPGDVPMNPGAIFDFDAVSYPELFAMTNWLNITFEQSERLYIWLFDPAGRGQVKESYSVSYPTTTTVEFMLTEDHQEVSTGTWTWLATTSELAIFYSDFITPIENGSVEIEGHNTTLGNTLSYTASEGWVSDFSVPVRNTGDVYSFAVEVLLEFEPEAGSSKFYSYYPNKAIAPNGNWVDLDDPAFTITDLAAGSYNVSVLVWDLAYEIIATGSYNITISSHSGNGPDIGGVTSVLSIVFALGILIMMRTETFIKKKPKVL